MLGQVLLDKYRVARLLDEGGMCKIWLARQLDVPREVVVKVLQEKFAGQPKPRELLRREIHILSRFQHPNAVSYYDAAPNDPIGPILIMEYLRGLDLCTLLQREGRLLPERAGRLLAQLCGVLGAAHKAGIVHRDIKPANVMIVYPCTTQETVKLMDFGLARMASLLYIGADDLLDSALPSVAGTPEYIAPEQAQGHDMDGRGDLYSVGVMLYEMLSGRRPFEHTRAEDLLYAHASAEPPSFADRDVTHVPPAVEAVIRACLAKHPDQRPSDAAELLQRYEDAVGKRLSAPVPRASGVFNVRQALSAPSLSGSVPRVPSTPVPAGDRQALRQDFQADMPEAMAMLKLKGFLHDLGSSVIESEPGRIRVRLGEPEKPKKTSGLFALLDRTSRKSGTVPRSIVTDVELRMARPDLSRPNRLLLTLIMRPSNGLATPEWRTRCQQIAQDLKAYLMG
jgi:serine/threonine protein kinase